MIRDVQSSDVDAVRDIYNYYIEHTVVSFEELPVTATEMRNRVQTVTEDFPWIVFVENDTVLGYAYASKWHSRCAYRSTVESTVYLAPSETVRGIGTKLYGELLDRLRQLPVHSVIGGIALPNPGSVALHEKFGFKKAAHYQEVGYKMDRWIDVGYWQLILDDERAGAAPDRA